MNKRAFGSREILYWIVNFRPHKWAKKIMICDAFFLPILPKPHFISTPFMHFVQLWWLSQVVGPGFEPGLVLEFFCFPASRSWVRTSPSPYFFCNKRVAENIPVLSGRLVLYTMQGFETLKHSNFQKVQ